MEDVDDLASKLDRLEDSRIAALSGISGPLLTLYYGFFPKVCDDPTIIQGLLSGINPSLRYNPVGHISKNEFVSSEIFTKKISRYKGCNLITGKIGSTDMRFSMVHAEEKCKRETTDSKGRKRTETYYVTFFEGVLFSADFNKNITGLTAVRSHVGTGFFSKSKVKLEDPRFNKFFSVESSDQIEARYILTPSLIERLIEIRNKFGAIDLSFTGERVVLALPMRYGLFDLKTRSSDAIQSQAEILRARLKLIVGLVHDLDLNTRIWAKK